MVTFKRIRQRKLRKAHSINSRELILIKNNVEMIYCILSKNIFCVWACVWYRKIYKDKGIIKSNPIHYILHVNETSIIWQEQIILTNNNVRTIYRLLLILNALCMAMYLLQILSQIWVETKMFIHFIIVCISTEYKE